MPTLTDSELFIDSGYLSGLAAQSELSRLLDEIFGSCDLAIPGMRRAATRPLAPASGPSAVRSGLQGRR